MRTVGAGIAKAAAATPAKDVYIAGGTYDETANAADNVGLYGGYAPFSGARSNAEETIISGSPQAVLADGDQGVVLQLLTLRGAPTGNASEAARTAYGLRAINNSTVALSKVRANVADALAGSGGANGGNGSVGFGGSPGASFNSSSCSGGSPGSGGPGAFFGGRGGQGGCNAPGNSGFSGSGPFGGSAGSGGFKGQNGLVGGNGGNGNPGASGANARFVTTSASTVWTSGVAQDGVAGTAGSGGGGGGGGGGNSNPCSFANATGGGGGGGGFGSGGRAGQNGGSFAVYAHNSSAVVVGSELSSGAGGNGGGGGGGAGGPSIGIFTAGTGSFVRDSTTTITPGTAGTGGLQGGSTTNRADGGVRQETLGTVSTTSDFDADGVADANDACPDIVKGDNDANNDGCPDRPAADAHPPDPPVIVGPANNSYGTDGTVTISGTAEESMADGGTVTVRVFDGTTFKGTAQVNASGAWFKTLSAVPNGRHTYTANAVDAASNTSGVSNARTVTVDTVKPRIVGVSPPANATGVARTANVVATFDEKMRATTLTPKTFKLFKVKANGTTTQITNAPVTLSSNGLKATLNPFGDTATLLARKTRYKAVVTTGAKDLAGNPLSAGKTWTFTVRK
ncbi:MAG TPA: Ig-like domain-containing protein [Rubrobacter sp.]|nr:Ig-like domain-containing protein [Rubrobacter sp.]